MYSYSYSDWYQRVPETSFDEAPISTTLDGLEAIINDPLSSPERKSQAIAYLRRIRKKTWTSDLLAVYAGLAAAISSIAYFMAMRQHPLNPGAWLAFPIIAGVFVAAATWYTYRHDTAELILHPNFIHRKKDSTYAALLLMTGLILSLELALSGYGVYKCLDDHVGTDIQIGLIFAVCLGTLFTEFAQTYKYLEKWIDPNEKYDWRLLKDKQFAGYMFCSVVMLFFSGMAIYPLLENTVTSGAAAAAIILYVLLGLPCLWKKAELQIASQNKSAKTTAQTKIFTGVRIGNGLGDLAFSAFGFFETMKALKLIKKPRDIFSGLDDSFSHAVEPWSIVLLGFAVAVCSCVGSYLMTADGNEESYRSRINRTIPESSTPSLEKNDTMFFVWQKKSDLPSVDKVQNMTPKMKTK